MKDGRSPVPLLERREGLGAGFPRTSSSRMDMVNDQGGKEVIRSHQGRRVVEQARLKER